MSTTTLISLIVVVVAFALFFYLSFKGVNLFLTVFACTLLVSFCTPDGITSIFTAFLPSVGTMFQQFLLLYTIGGAFGFCLMESGLGSAMATHLIKVFGEKWIAVALFVITCLMMAAGVASYQYAILAIALPVLKKLNMSRKVALAAMSAGRLRGLRHTGGHAKRPEHRTHHLSGHHHHGRCGHQPGLHRLLCGVHRGLPHHAHQPPEEEGRGLRLLYR